MRPCSSRMFSPDGRRRFPPAMTRWCACGKSPKDENSRRRPRIMTRKRPVASSLVLIGLALALLVWIGSKAWLQPAASEEPQPQRARYPNAVQKEVVFKGQSARDIAELLGLDPKAKTEAAYRLHPMNEW